MLRNFIAGSSKWAGGHDNHRAPAKRITEIPPWAAIIHVRQALRPFISAFRLSAQIIQAQLLNLATTLPFRFKAGGDSKMPSAVTSHSHRATTKVNNKSFKSRKATKGSLRDQAKGM